jgi:hypothetical protein
MPQVNLDDMVVKQTFFVPIGRKDLGQLILNELNKYNPPLKSFPAWNIKESENCIEFTLSHKYTYICSHLLKFDEEEIARLAKQFESSPAKGLPTASLGGWRSCEPSEVYVIITRKEDKGCEIEVECLPTLYRKISQNVVSSEEVQDFDVQDANVTCKRFLRTIFIGGLSGTPIGESKQMLSETTMEFLINDPFLRQITEKLELMLDNAVGEILIFGYMGTLKE